MGRVQDSSGGASPEHGPSCGRAAGTRSLWEPRLGEELGSEQSSGSFLRGSLQRTRVQPQQSVCPPRAGLSLPVCALGWSRRGCGRGSTALSPRALPSRRGLTPSQGPPSASPRWMGRAEEGSPARTLLLQLQGKRSEGQEGQEVQFRAASSPVLSVNLSVPLPRSCTFTLRPLNALLAPALSALLNRGPEGLIVQRLFSIVSMCSFPLASSKDLEPKTPLVPCQG